MTYGELKQAAFAYRNALLIERSISGSGLRRVERIFRIATIVVCVGWLCAFGIARVPYSIALIPVISQSVLPWYLDIKAVFLLLLGVWLLSVMLTSFYASSYDKDIDPALPEPWLGKRPKIRYELAAIVTSGYEDPLLDFFASRFGRQVAMRLGLSPKAVMTFLHERGAQTSETFVIPDADAPLGLEAFAQALLRSDETLRKMLAASAIDDDDFIGAAEWVSRIEEGYKEHTRFWGRDALGRIPGIGKDWAYGETALLERFAQEIVPGSRLAMEASGSFGKAEAEEVERILSRGREANVLLVGEEGVPKLAVLARLARRIASGLVLPPLEHKRIFIFDGTLFVSAMKERAGFEAELLSLLGEAAKAGNIIFVFDNFDTFIAGGKQLGSDVLSLIDPFLDSAAIQLVGVVDTGAYHQMLEPNAKIRERFEHISIEGTGVKGSLPILGDEALRSEYEEGVFFTYPALRSIAESADRYFFEGIMPDKAIDLLKELVPKVKALHKRVITRTDVEELISKKTGIATGIAKGEERTKLLKLEEILHERIVGQEEAIKAISGALRRARSGIGNPNRPIGSFLFLGPTGVGKTETTKALAQVFFGDEKAISRLDMSEYATPDALHRLIGDFESGKPGILGNLLRERPYGVLLLDEFEKTNKDIHDLFLQILDEGFFTDAGGKRVNARNLMIIATSNAASDVIWQSAQEEKTLDKDRVITEIINRAIFKPELLNRFDGVILFHPLRSPDLRSIAKFQLQKLEKRLETKGLELVINDALLDYLVSIGQDPKFGARPMNRAIAEKVEQVIAEKMLRGEISPGSKVELSGMELA